MKELVLPLSLWPRTIKTENFLFIFVTRTKNDLMLKIVAIKGTDTKEYIDPIRNDLDNEHN